MRDEESSLLPLEALPLKDFLVVEEEGNRTGGQSPRKQMKELLAERKAARVNAGRLTSRYIPAVKKTILGLGAEVERVWSMAGKVLTKDRSSMSPLVFECIMYLKYNEKLWGLAEVVEANKRCKNTSIAAKARDSRMRVNMDKVVVTTWEAFRPTE